MQTDIQQWQGSEISDVERWIIKMGIGYFSAAEGIVGDNILHVVRELVTAPELKLVLGRHAHEENIHADSLVYMISSLGINPHECEAMFEDIPTIKAKNHFVVSNSRALRRDVDLTILENKQALAKNIFMFGQVMEGTQFYGLFGMILSLYRQNKFPGIGQMFRYTLRDESNHINVFLNLLNSLVMENPEIMTPEFKEDLRQTMAEGVRLEKEFIRDCLPVERALAAAWLQPSIRGQRCRLGRRAEQGILCRSDAGCGQRFDPGDRVRNLPDGLCRHHPCPDRRRLP